MGVGEAIKINNTWQKLAVTEAVSASRCQILMISAIEMTSMS